MTHDFHRKSNVVIPLSESRQQNSSVCPLDVQAAVLHCYGKRSLPSGSRRLNGTKGIGEVTTITSLIPGCLRIEVYENQTMRFLPMKLLADTVESGFFRYLLRGYCSSENVRQYLPCRGEDHRRSWPHIIFHPSARNPESEYDVQYW